MLKNSVVIFIIMISLNNLKAQENFVSSGGDAYGDGGYINFSIGQIVYSQNKGNTGTIDQGLQQPFEISTVSSINYTAEIDLSISTYPNPTDNILILKIDNYDINDLDFQLFDIQGKLILNNNIENNKTNIDMRQLTSATYYLRVIKNDLIFKTFKIIKN